MHYTDRPSWFLGACIVPFRLCLPWTCHASVYDDALGLVNTDQRLWIHLLLFLVVLAQSATFDDSTNNAYQ